MKTGGEEKGMKISGRTVIVIIVASVVVGAALTAASFYLNGAPTGTTTMTGTLYVNGSGQLNGTSQYEATYNVSLASKDGIGMLNLTLLSRSGDILTTHSYAVTGLVATPYDLNMSLDGNSVRLSWLSNTTVWKQYNQSYVASWSASAPSDQVVGVLSPQDFAGVPAGYYIFLSLTVPSQPSDSIPFAIRSLG